MLEASGWLPQNVNFGIKAELIESFMRANRIEPVGVDAQPARETTAVASEGQRYTFLLKCRVR